MPLDLRAEGRGLGLLFGSPALVDTLQSYLEG